MQAGVLEAMPCHPVALEAMPCHPVALVGRLDNSHAFKPSIAS